MKLRIVAILALVFSSGACQDISENVPSAPESQPNAAVVGGPHQGIDGFPDLPGARLEENQFCRLITEDIYRCIGRAGSGQQRMVPVTLEQDGQIIHHFGMFQAEGREGRDQFTEAPNVVGEGGVIAFAFLDDLGTVHVLQDGEVTSFQPEGFDDVYNSIRVIDGEVVIMTAPGEEDARFALDGERIN